MLHGQLPSRMAEIHYECFPDNTRPEITCTFVSRAILGIDYSCIRSIHHYLVRRNLLLIRIKFQVTRFLSMSTPSTHSVIRWPRRLPLLRRSLTMFEFLAGSLEGRFQWMVDLKKLWILLMGFKPSLFLLVQPNWSLTCLPTSSLVCFMYVYELPSIKTHLAENRPHGSIAVHRGPFNFAFDSEGKKSFWSNWTWPHLHSDQFPEVRKSSHRTHSNRLQ